MSLLQACLLVVACAACTMAQLGTVYVLQPAAGNDVSPNNTANQTQIRNDITISTVEYFEWQGYDGWFNNPAHPEWGGAGNYI